MEDPNRGIVLLSSGLSLASTLHLYHQTPSPAGGGARSCLLVLSAPGALKLQSTRRLLGSAVQVNEMGPDLLAHQSDTTGTTILLSEWLNKNIFRLRIQYQEGQVAERYQRRRRRLLFT